jgi:hypothetical protein
MGRSGASINGPDPIELLVAIALLKREERENSAEV